MIAHLLSRGLVALLMSLGLIGAVAGTAWGEGEGSIDHAETRDGTLRVLYSVPELEEGIKPDLTTLEVSVNGTPLEAEGEVAGTADAAEQVRRTTVMAIDTSRSMTGERFTQAKAAAKAFLDSAPGDVYVGIVAFAGDVQVVHEPSLDRAAAAAVLDDLSLTLKTRLYDGVIAATEAAGTEGQRSLLVLSDGRDTSSTDLDSVVQTIADADVRVDVVALGDGAAEANPALEAMATEGDGAVVAAADPEALTALFNEEAAALSRQVLVSATLPDDFTSNEGSVAVSVQAGGETYSDSAFLTFEAGSSAPSETSATEPRFVEANPLSRPEFLLVGLGALGLGALAILLIALGVLGKRDSDSVALQIAAYTRAGAPRKATVGGKHGRAPADGATGGVTQSAVGIAQKALAGSGGFESRLGSKLDSADIALKPAEWILVHSGIAVGTAVVGLLLSGGNFFLALMLFLVGAVLPWLYLGIKKSRRLKAFNAQLAETLQLMAGSLSAGLSLAQSLDTVVREGSDPIAAEFRRALIEARLGVQVEDSLDNIAKRMESKDFEWVVMAIRIQREVGGNLSELLLKVAATMRERDYLRRQVKTLSAEGKMSAYILGALPPGMFAYMMVANREYVSTLYTTTLGWMMLIGAAVLMGIGSFWMSRIVKVDV